LVIGFDTNQVRNICIFTKRDNFEICSPKTAAAQRLERYPTKRKQNFLFHPNSCNECFKVPPIALIQAAQTVRARAKYSF